MTSVSIVKHFDVIKHIGSGKISSFIDAFLDARRPRLVEQARVVGIMSTASRLGI